MALTPSELRRRKMNLLMAMSYAAYASTKSWTPLQLFAAGEQGAWYDPSDFSTMFQDSAGTTPVTAVEQPVGLIRDKSGRANHASQSTAASRPVLSARVNLLTYSEQFDNAAWGLDNGTAVNPVVTANAGTAPDGATTADRIVFNKTGGTFSRMQQASASVTGVNYTFSVWMRTVGGGTSNVGVRLDTTGVNAVVTGSWQRFSVSANGPAGSIIASQILLFDSIIGNDETADIYVWGADLRVTNDGVGIPTYQRVAAATDYDTTGFPLYLKFDGTDDSLATGSIDPGSVDKAQVFAGYRRLTDAGAQILLETSSTLAFNNGAFGWVVPDSATNRASYNLRGTAITAQIDSLTAAAPNTLVTAALYDLSQSTSATEILIRLNGTSASTTLGGAADAGTGNFLAYPLYIGRRGGASLPFNGNLYSLIVRFSAANLSDAQIASTETWVNGKTSAF